MIKVENYLPLFKKEASKKAFNYEEYQEFFQEFCLIAVKNREQNISYIKACIDNWYKAKLKKDLVVEKYQRQSERVTESKNDKNYEMVDFYQVLESYPQKTQKLFYLLFYGKITPQKRNTRKSLCYIDVKMYLKNKLKWDLCDIQESWTNLKQIYREMKNA